MQENFNKIKFDPNLSGGISRLLQGSFIFLLFLLFFSKPG